MSKPQNIETQRRKFIKTGLAASAALLLPAPFLDAAAPSALKKLTILHTNDQHSRIEPFKKSKNKRYSGRGGFAQRAALIDKIRQTEKNVLLLDAGDVFQGTPYFNVYKGELEFKLMSMMGYDVATLGNHDFDLGLSGLKKQLKHAKFDFVNANYDFTNTLLENTFKPYKIIKKAGIKVGIFGLGIDLSDLVPKESYGQMTYQDPISVAQQVVAELKQKKCQLIICLSHLGYAYKNDPKKVSDLTLAKATRNIDLIIGGHTHTFLDAPVSVQNADGKPVLINQVGWAGLYLGRIDFYFSRGKQAKTITHRSMPVANQNYVMG